MNGFHRFYTFLSPVKVVEEVTTMEAFHIGDTI